MILRIVHVALHLRDQRHLRVGLAEFLLIFRSVGISSGSVGFQLHDVVAALVAFQLPLGIAQFGIDLLQSAVDKLLGAAGNLVLVLIGLLIIAYRKLLHIVQRPLRILVVEGQLGDGSGLAGLCGGELIHIFIRGHERRIDKDPYTFTVLHGGIRTLRKADGAYTRIDGRGQSLYGTFKIKRSLGRHPVDRHIALAQDLIAVALAGNLQLHRLVELVEMVGIHIHIDRLLAIEQLIFHLADKVIVDVDLHVLHHLQGKRVRREDLHLVVKTIGI